MIAVAINTVNAAEVDNCSEENMASSDVDIIASNDENVISSTDNNIIASTDENVYTSIGTTHTYTATGKSVYIKDFNPKYKLSNKAKKQMESVKKSAKKTYKLTIDHDTYKSLKKAKNTNGNDYYTFNTNYKCKVLKPIFKTKTIKKTIFYKKYTNRQKYINDYNRYFIKYNTGKYNMDVKFHLYEGTDIVKYVTIKVTKKVKQTIITKFKSAGYTKVKAEICYSSHEGQLGKGSHLFFYGKTFGYDFSNYVATKHNFKF